MDVYDVRWVTNFDEKMAEINGNNVSSKKKGEYKMYLYVYTIDDRFIYAHIRL